MGKSNPGGVKNKRLQRSPGQIARQQRRLGTPRPAPKPAWSLGGRRRIDPFSALAEVVATQVKKQAKSDRNMIAVERDVAEGLKVAELQALCKDRGIKFTTKMRKPQLIEMLCGR